jgi:hypothetical protein
MPMTSPPDEEVTVAEAPGGVRTPWSEFWRKFQ